MGFKKYLRNQFRWRMCLLECDDPEDFYLSPLQRGRSCLPLLVLRTLLFLFSLSVVVVSLVSAARAEYFGYWLIYLTHWGLLAITFATFLATVVSFRCYFYGPFDATFGLPWYVKLYWVVFNSAATSALLITVFYWALLTDTGDGDYAASLAEDVLTHGMNSGVMLLLLLASRHQARLLHVYQPVAMGLLYIGFTVVYYYAGGISGFGTVWIYPMVNWASPGPTTLVVAGTALLMLLLHVLLAGAGAARDALGRCYRHERVLQVHR